MKTAYSIGKLFCEALKHICISSIAVIKTLYYKKSLDCSEVLNNYGKYPSIVQLCEK